jgi:DNA-directed RNA polymerase subunit RPC12/RpoP
MDKCVKCGNSINFGVRRETTKWKIDKSMKNKRIITVRCPHCGTHNSKEVEE